MKNLSTKQLQETINKAEFELYAELRTNIQVIDMVFTYILSEKEFPNKDQQKELKKCIKSLTDFLITIKK